MPHSPRRRVRLSPRIFTADGKDRGIGALIVCTSWILQRLPGLVLDHQRSDVIETLSTAQTIVVEITPSVGVRILSGDRLLLDIPSEIAAIGVRRAGRWSRAD